MVNSVLKSIRILRLLADTPNLRGTDIARGLGLPKSTVHSILATLGREGLVERSGDPAVFHLGVRLLELGHRAQATLDICRVAAPFLRGLNNQFDETVHLTVLDRDEVLYVDCIESHKRLRTYSVIGVRAPLHCTSVGKAIMAYLDAKEVERIVREKGLRKFTAKTITSESRLQKELETIRQRGYAIDDCEHEDHLRCLGAPVRNAWGQVFASVSLSGPAVRNTLSRLRKMSGPLLSATREISRRLGYTGA